MSNSTLVKNGLMLAVVQMSAWFVNNGCNFIKFISDVLSHVFCYIAVMYLWMLLLGLKSEDGMRQGCISVLHGLLAALSARSLPGNPTWPRTSRGECQSLMPC